MAFVRAKVFHVISPFSHTPVSIFLRFFSDYLRRNRPACISLVDEPSIVPALLPHWIVLMKRKRKKKQKNWMTAALVQQRRSRKKRPFPFETLRVPPVPSLPVFVPEEHLGRRRRTWTPF